MACLFIFQSSAAPSTIALSNSSRSAAALRSAAACLRAARSAAFVELGLWPDAERGVAALALERGVALERLAPPSLLCCRGVAMGDPEC